MTRSALDVAEDQFRLLVNSVEDYAIFLLDPAGNVASWNAGARMIKGYSREEIIGKHVSVFYTPEDRAAEKPQHLLDAAARQGRIEEFAFLSVAIGICHNSQRRLSTYAEVSQVGSDLKKQAKKRPGSAFVVDRRKD